MVNAPSDEREEPERVSGVDVMERGVGVEGKVSDERRMVLREEEEEKEEGVEEEEEGEEEEEEEEEK